MHCRILGSIWFVWGAFLAVVPLAGAQSLQPHRAPPLLTVHDAEAAQPLEDQAAYLQPELAEMAVYWNGPQATPAAYWQGQPAGPILYHQPAEQIAAPTAVAGEEEKKEDEKKEKKWYEKLSVRGYAQFRFNDVVHMSGDSARPNYAGDSSIGDNRTFLIRRARVIIAGDVTDHLYVYLQPDFASGVPGSSDSEYYTQIRDWYGDVYLTEDKVHRLRIGQSKVPYGWENLQSSSNRVPLDRNDGLNSAVRNERDLGIFYYYTPEWTQDVFKYVLDEGLKGSGNYGMFGIGIYDGQGGSFREQNDEVHAVARFTYPWVFDNGQIIETGIQAYTGDYVVLGSPIQPLGVGPTITPAGVGAPGQLDQRIGGSFIMYPQPFGFQAEWNIGRGPALNEAQTEVIDRPLYGGYAMALWKIDTECHGTFFPFIRYTHFVGGYKSYRNAPFSDMRDWEVGCEWQFGKGVEFTTSYLIADRTNLTSLATGESYLPFEGHVVRFQVQINY